MKILDIPQHLDDGAANPDWLAARAGKVTASRINDVMAKVKSGEAASYRNYRAQLAAEILTGTQQEMGFVSKEMQWGTQQEEFARVNYSLATGLDVSEVGIVFHPTIERGAASPDGLISPDGLVEIKCPNTATHIDYLLDGTVPTQYQNQMLWQMACTGAEWCDFVSFDPRLPDQLQLFIVRFHRDPARIAEIEATVRTLLAQVDEMVAKLAAIHIAA